MPHLWDLYLDADDAASILRAAAALERHYAIREPLPLDDLPRLLDRLWTVARIAQEEATYWGYEAEDRRLEAAADGGRWGNVEVAAKMSTIAAERAAGCREVAAAANAGAKDLAPRLSQAITTDALMARRETREQARRLLEAHDRDNGGEPPVG